MLSEKLRGTLKLLSSIRNANIFYEARYICKKDYKNSLPFRTQSKAISNHLKKFQKRKNKKLALCSLRKYSRVSDLSQKQLKLYTVLYKSFLVNFVNSFRSRSFIGFLKTVQWNIYLRNISGINQEFCSELRK